MSYLPAFILSMVLTLMIRNYFKYNVHSFVGSFYGHRSIGSMCRILLFDQDSRDQHTLADQTAFIKHEQVLETFGISTGNFTNDSWKREDHLEYPFSVGSFHPKCSSDEAAASPVWDPSAVLDNVDDEWNSDEEEGGLLQGGSQRSKGGVPNKHPTSARPQCSGETPVGLSTSFSYSTLPVDPYDTSTYQEPTTSGTIIVIPDQNVKSKPAKKGKVTAMQRDAEKFHQKISRATLHFYDDRVFLVEDKEEAQRLLALNKSKNPIRRMVNPVLGEQFLRTRFPSSLIIYLLTCPNSYRHCHENF